MKKGNTNGSSFVSERSFMIYIVRYIDMVVCVSQFAGNQQMNNFSFAQTTREEKTNLGGYDVKNEVIDHISE